VEDRRVRVRLLGAFEVEGVAERDLGSRKGRLLLKVLAAARGAPVPVDRLAEVLWGEDQPARPADQVGVLVSRLRGVLGAHRLPRSDAGYALLADWTDVAALLELSAAAAEALEAGRVGAARAAADAALALARGPLLADEDGLWPEADRVAAQAAVTRLRRLAVDAAVAAGDHGGAAALAEQALAADPYDEAMLRALMSAHLGAGRPASALAAYARVRHRLAEDLGVPPTAETEALHNVALVAADGDTGGPAPAIPATRAAPAPAGLVGRDAELAVLDAALAEVAGGATTLVIVEGDTGMGKTMLVDAWAARARAVATVLWGRCDELGRDLPIQPVADALADHLRAAGTERAAVVVGDDAATLAPLLGPVAGPAATVVSDTDAGRARMFAALVAALERVGEGGATVLVLEDLHRAGPSTRAWLAFARRRCRSTLIVVTTRAGGAAGVDASHHLHLGPLGLEAVVELVGPERAAELYERSGGHPLLLAALAHSPADADALPADLRDAVASRIDGLGDRVAATLRVAAILGPECDLDLVAEVAGAPVVAVLGHLEAAARAGILAERGNRFEFRHQLVREALEVAGGAARRALVHREAARLLSARPDRDPLGVALHARAGGDAALASASFVAAAAAAAVRFDLDAAEDYLASALDLVETAEAYVARARLRMGRQALDAAAADAERAVALGGGAAALEVAGWVAYYRRRHDDARAFAEAAANRATDPALQISAQALAGRVHHGAGDLAAAIGYLETVQGGPPEVRGVAEVWLAQVRVHQGRPLDALDALAGPMADPDSLAHPWAPLHLRFNRVLALGQRGRVAEALQVVDDLGVAVERAGPVGVRFTAPAANAESWILRWSGRGDEADERNRAAVAATGDDHGPSGHGLGEAHWVALLDLADGCLLRDDLAGAAALAGRLAPLDTWGGTMAWHQRHRLGLLRARLALAGGDRATAAGLASTVADDAAGRGAGRYELLARAFVALADPAVPDDEVAATIDGLGRCAVLDGWPLVAALARARRADAWRAEAARWAGQIVTSAASADAAHGEAARRLADRLLRA
jgi:DNA-binding SARP family transcriptional activator